MYYKVFVKNIKDNEVVPVICESISKIDSIYFGKSYVFRDLITGRIIKPLYDGYNDNSMCLLTYDNSSKSSFIKISSKNVLYFLKRINTEVIELYHNTLNRMENDVLENCNTRKKNNI